MYVCMYIYICVCVCVCVCVCTFKWIIFVVEVLESMNKIIKEYFLDNPVLRLVTILKSIKELQRVSAESINRNLEKWLQRNLICILESCSVSLNKIFEMHHWKNYFFQFTLLLVIFVTVLMKTACLFTFCTMKTKFLFFTYLF